ncbi:MAG: ion transporter [Syntrophaceae bacterium]|nr:ion transporter [Syntrophaceae bacterium]
MSISKERLYTIIFEADTPEGKFFDVALIFVILLSVILVMMESVDSFRAAFQKESKFAEWIITALFTVEYMLRIWVLKKPWKYIKSFFGIVDLLAVLPSYLGLFFMGGQSLLVIRSLRLLRVFRILKLTRYSRASRTLAGAVRASLEKILVFLFFVLTMVIIFGTIMYLIEGQENGFTNIPTSIYWAIVTLTTVGYGDISPATPLGQLLASLIMILGYGIIAVPTGIVTAQMMKPVPSNTQVCPNCMFDRHDDDARHCKKCGAKLD